MYDNKPKILLILGATASGKTALAVKLALKYNGEIVSADSRQVYRGMDVGTGKDLAEYQVGKKRIPYHLIDVASPKTKFNLAKYQKLAFKAIVDILERKKLPIIVGGSGLYLQALVDNYKLVDSKPDFKKRNSWEKLTAEQLVIKIKKLKPEFAARLNNSDKNNRRRLARYLEIIMAGGEAAPIKQVSPYDFLLLGIKVSDDILRTRIVQRLLVRLEKEGLIAEVKRLNQEGISWEKLKSFGLEYKFISSHLLGEMSYPEMVDKLSIASWHFAKRQKTWFKRWEKQGTKINWIKDQKQAERYIKKWL